MLSLYKGAWDKMNPIYEKIYAVVRRIPAGRFSTYGRIACLAGNQRWSRLVGAAMRACKDQSLPCHRVLYQDGTPSPAWQEGEVNLQRLFLEKEGVAFTAEGKADPAFLWPQ